MDTVWIIQAVSGFAVGSLVAALVLSFGHSRRTNRKKKIEIPQRDRAQTTFVFSGNLKQTGLFDAIQFLEIGRRQGVLHIYSGRRKGYLTFVEGKVVDSFYRNHTGREALLEMLELGEGDFYFEPRNVVQPRLMAESIVDLAFALDTRREH